MAHSYMSMLLNMSAKPQSGWLEEPTHTQMHPHVTYTMPIMIKGRVEPLIIKLISSPRAIDRSIERVRERADTRDLASSKFVHQRHESFHQLRYWD